MNIELKQRHKFKGIRKFETILEVSGKKYHESIFRSYNILNLVKEMLERNDSKETILDIIEFLEN